MNNQKLSEAQRTKAGNLLRIAAVQGERAAAITPQINALKKEIEGDKLSLKETATLTKDFTGESVARFQESRNPNDLRTYEPEEQEEASEFTKLVRLSGFSDDLQSLNSYTEPEQKAYLSLTYKH